MPRKPQPLYLVVDHSTNALVAVTETEADADLLCNNTAAALAVYEVEADHPRAEDG